MLKHLYIKNFTLINELDIDFYPAFSVITGETGAGKSIILGALHLLLGQRADSKQVKSGSTKCIIEATFDISRYGMNDFFTAHDIDYDGECILRREVNASGKSRAFINDTPVPLTDMRELGEQLVDIHSQHQNLLLQKEDFQLSVVDIIAADGEQRSCYLKAYKAYQAAKKAYEDCVRQTEQSKENEEYLRCRKESRPTWNSSSRLSLMWRRSRARSTRPTAPSPRRRAASSTSSVWRPTVCRRSPLSIRR